MQFLKDFRRRLEQLGPYPSLLVLAIPLVIVEPFKLVAVLVAGDGHFLTGLLFLICAYVVSLVVTERLFVILKPKLLMLPWFAKSWRWFLALRRRGLRWLRSLWTPAGKFYLAADASGGGAPNGPTYGDGAFTLRTHKSGSMSASVRKRTKWSVAAK
jgi:hypothetical protein